VKHLTAIFLLLLFSVLATMLPIRPGFRHVARRLMERRIEHGSDAKTITVAAITIHSDAWEDEHEFRLDGKLYDVVSEAYVNGKKYYQCYVDELEVSAEKQADDLVKEIVAPQPTSPQGKMARALADWLSALYHTPAHSLQLHPRYLAKTDYPAALIALIPKPALQRFAPPPEA
jgi:hypothetical protein